MRRSLAMVAAASLLVSCINAATPSPSTLSPSSGPSGPSPSASPARSWVRLVWESVDAPVIPDYPYIVNILSSKRGLLLRVLEDADSSAISVQTTADGRAWTMTSTTPTSPLGRSLDGLDEWLQLMIREGDDPGVDLLESTNGIDWTLRSRLPDGMLRAAITAVRGRTIVVCGAQQDMTVSVETCAVSTDEGSTWRPLPELDPVIASGDLMGLAASDRGFLLAVRRDVDGVVMGGGAISADGVSWERLEPAAGLEDLAPDIGPRFAALPSGFVITGAVLEGRDYIRGIWTSPDGRTWRRVGLPRTLGWVGDLHVASGIVVAGAADGVGGEIRFTGLFASTDGATWRTDSVPSALADTYEWEWHVTPIADELLFLNAARHVARLVRGVPTSDPGPPPAPPATAPPEPTGAVPPVLTWETAAIEPEGHVEDVTLRDDRLIAVGQTIRDDLESHSAIWTSPDGATWTLLPTPRVERIRLTAVTTDGDRTIAVGTEFTPHVADDLALSASFWWSADGRTWTQAPKRRDHAIGIGRDDTIEPGMSDVVPWRGGYVAVGGVTGTVTKPVAWASSDGTSWARMAVPGDGAMLGVVPFRDALVAVGTTGGPMSEGRVWRSEDGRSWELVSTPAGFDVIRVATDGSTLVATGWGTRIWWSTDGRGWHPVPDQPSLLPETSADRIRTVATTALGFVASGARTCPDDSGEACPAVWASADALRWSRADLATEAVGVGSQLRMLPDTSIALGDRAVVIGGYDFATLEQGWRVWIGEDAAG